MSARIERLLRIYNRMRRGPVTIEIMSKWAASAGIKVSDRQLYRDLNELARLQIAEEVNIVEYTDEKNKKIWKVEYEETYDTLTQYDINSFFLLKNFAPYTILEQRKSSIEKFERIIYKGLSKNKYQKFITAHEHYMYRTNYMDNMYGEIEHKQIEDLIWALQNKRSIVITEERLNVANIHNLENAFPIHMLPMELVFHSGRLHIAGLALKTMQLLIFALDSTFKFHLTNETFNRKKYIAQYQQKTASIFGLSDPKEKRVYDVKLEFTKGFAETFKNHYWHRTQKWEQLKNGNYMLHLKCSIGRELVGFIALGLDKMKVHHPQVLKDLILKKMQQTAAIYLHNMKIDEDKANADY